MIKEDFYFEWEKGQKIFVRKWTPDKDVNAKCVIQIAHGMAEHSLRYESFAERLTDEGFIVYANDHIGHGKTASDIDALGFFSENNGWQLVVDSIAALTKKIKTENESLPIFILGHSMGSLLLRTMIIQNKLDINGAILSGTTGNSGLLGKIGKLIVKNEIKRRGKKAKSKLMTKLSFGNFNKAFKETTTSFDWLTRDKEIVKEYIEDPYCGTIFTAGFYLDMLEGIEYINKFKNISKNPKDLNVFFISGEKDPVGKDGKGVKEVYNKFKKIGMKNVSLKLYEGARHEVLNEINREEVYKDIVDWVKNNI